MIMNQKKLIRPRFIIPAVLGVAFSWMMLQPVWFRWDTSTLQGGQVMILNPFRSRASERTAESFLRELSSERAIEALAKVPRLNQKHLAGIAERERQYPIHDWHLIWMKDEAGETRWLAYSVNAQPGEKCGCDDVDIILRRKDGGWLIEDYRRGY